MRLNLRRIMMAGTLTLGGGVLLAGPGSSCTTYAGQSALVAIDACFIFDCDAALGGILGPCDVNAATVGEVNATPTQLFMDCP